MLIPVTSAQASIEVKRSRFIADACAVQSESDIREELSSRRMQFPDASHVVYAWLLNPEATLFGMSDDHEPHHTAGRPVLEVLKGSDITNILITVVRYFGGTKLGTGGLVKAYTSAAQEVLKYVKTEELVPKQYFQIKIGYEFYKQTQLILESCSAVLGDVSFTTDICITGTIPVQHTDEAVQRITDLTSGKADLTLSPS